MSPLEELIRNSEMASLKGERLVCLEEQEAARISMHAYSPVLILTV